MLGACAPSVSPPASLEAAWQATRSTEDGVTTVVTRAGSKWGGTGVLSEELSIGVAEGADEYMLGQIVGLWVDEERILILDAQLPALRAYDRAGNHLGDIGGPGQGPGEFENPFGISVGDDGTIHVVDMGSLRVVRFAADGSPLTPLQLPTSIGGSIQVSPDNRVLARSVLFDMRDGRIDPSTQRPGYVVLGAPGSTAPATPIETPVHDSDVWRMRTGGWQTSVPYAPRVVVGLTRHAVTAVGLSDSYRVTLTHPDGRVVVAERVVEPVAMSSEERAYHRAWTTARSQSRERDWTWTGPEVPQHKPYFASLIGDQGDRLLVVRYAPSRRQTDCLENPTVADFAAPPTPVSCWESRLAWDFFNLEGEFLGEVERPDVAQLGAPFMRDRVFALSVEGEDGVIRAKVFRLVLPGD